MRRSYDIIWKHAIHSIFCVSISHTNTFARRFPFIHSTLSWLLLLHTSVYSCGIIAQWLDDIYGWQVIIIFHSWTSRLLRRSVDAFFHFLLLFASCLKCEKGFHHIWCSFESPFLTLSIILTFIPVFLLRFASTHPSFSFLSFLFFKQRCCLV